MPGFDIKKPLRHPDAKAGREVTDSLIAAVQSCRDVPTIVGNCSIRPTTDRRHIVIDGMVVSPDAVIDWDFKK